MIKDDSPVFFMNKSKSATLDLDLKSLPSKFVSFMIYGEFIAHEQPATQRSYQLSDF